MSQSDALRQRTLEKARQQLQDEMSTRREQITKTNTVSVGKVDERFTVQHEDVHAALGRATVGLVSLTDFKTKQNQLHEKAAAAAAGGAPGLQRVEAEKKRPKKPAVKQQTLSFALDDEEGEGGSGADGAQSGGSDAEAGAPLKRAKLLKNPDVDTSFLPDRERERLEQIEREQLAAAWREQQEKIKKEAIEITYSYWDGTGHRAKLVCKKGDTVATFLEKARQQFHDLRGTSVDNLMYIKEDLIIPHFYSFYDFIINKARGKSGPLFHFDVHDDVRLSTDATVERDESHPGKVVERRWYDRNKHIFPASRWEVYDPTKDYGSYTIGDSSTTANY